MADDETQGEAGAETSRAPARDEAVQAAPDADELPPEPAPREITPAPEDFASPPGFANYVWPLLWMALAGLLLAVLLAGGWHGLSSH